MKMVCKRPTLYSTSYLIVYFVLCLSDCIFCIMFIRLYIFYYVYLTVYFVLCLSDCIFCIMFIWLYYVYLIVYFVLCLSDCIFCIMFIWLYILYYVFMHYFNFTSLITSQWSRGTRSTPENKRFGGCKCRNNHITSLTFFKFDPVSRIMIRPSSNLTANLE